MPLAKIIPIALLEHYQQRTTTVAPFLRIMLPDGRVFRFGGTDRPVTFPDDGTYLPGFGLSDIESTEGTSVDNLEIQLHTSDTVLGIEILTGLWQGARGLVFMANYVDPGMGIEPLREGPLGEAHRLGETVYRFELLGLTHGINQTRGYATGPLCRARFADFPSRRPHARCGLDIADYRVRPAVVVSAAGPQQITCTVSRPDDFFGEGLLIGTAGANAHHWRKVRAYADGGAIGTFTTDLPFPFPVEPGDTFDAIPGCRGRLLEDCRNKYTNQKNHQAEHYGITGNQDIALGAAATADTPESSPGADGGGPGGSSEGGGE